MIIASRTQFHQERALVGAFSVITNLRMELFEALQLELWTTMGHIYHALPGLGLARTPHTDIVPALTMD